MLLQDVMARCIYAVGESKFQDALDPFVKNAMRHKFQTTDPKDPYNLDVEKRKTADAERLQRATEKRAALAVVSTPSTKDEISQARVIACDIACPSV